MINDVRFYAFDRSLNRFFCNLWSLFHWFFWFLDYMLVDEQNALCVRKCPENYYPVNNTCVPCDGACPKCKSAWARHHVNQPRCIDAIFTVLHLSIENVTLTSWRCRQVLAKVSRLRDESQFKLSAWSIWAENFHTVPTPTEIYLFFYRFWKRFTTLNSHANFYNQWLYEKHLYCSLYEHLLSHTYFKVCQNRTGKLDIFPCETNLTLHRALT